MVNSIHLVDRMNRKVVKKFKQHPIFPAYETLVKREDVEKTIIKIEKELEVRLDEFEKKDKLLERQRLEQRINFDLEQLNEYGTCPGIENYTMYLDGRELGQEPYTIIDYFPKDFLMIIDESHMSIPQIRGMYKGDQSRKKNLVDYGFRLPSALHNRPLMFEEFYKKTNKVLFVSATPSQFELEKDIKPAEQIVRPTGLLDPQIEIRKTEGQIDDIIKEIKLNVKNKERIFITTTTIKMSEDLTEYLKEKDIKCAFIHSELKTFQRADVLRKLRLGVFDVVIGINLLREGLDIPEASLMLILEADKGGMFRNRTALIQNIGRVSRNVNGRVIMYADSMSKSMKEAIGETDRRRTTQEEHNKKNNIKPKTIVKPLDENLNSKLFEKYDNLIIKKDNKEEYIKLIKELEVDMRLAAKSHEFETAAEIRDLIINLKGKVL
jgi:excinuclease ABC subunit B